MPSNDCVLTDQYCHDPIWNSLQEAVNGLDPANNKFLSLQSRESVLRARLLICERTALSLFMSNFSAWVGKHPEQFALIVSGIILITFASLSPTILAAVGFGPTGPVVQGIAAGIQSSIGSVSAGSAFAILQSAAMGGQAKAIFPLIGMFGAAMTIFGVVPAVEQVIRGIPDKIPELQFGEKAIVFQLEDSARGEDCQASTRKEVCRAQSADRGASPRTDVCRASVRQEICGAGTDVREAKIRRRTG